jgi:membrane fusion protein (multidrug efflux system)
MRTLTVYLLAIGVVVVGLFLGFPQWFLAASGPSADEADRRPDAPPVIVAPVGRAPFLDRLEALGTVRARESVEITATRADRVRSIGFEDGDVVEAGHVLVELHDEEERAQLEEALAEQERRQTEFDRVTELADRRISSAGDLDVARAQLEVAQARVERLRATLAEHRIVAPFGGLLGFRRISLGAYVETSMVITTLDDLGEVLLDITIPEAWLDAVRPGQPVVARTSAYPDARFGGKIRTIDSRLDPTTRSLVVRASLPNEDLRLRPGLLMTVTIERDDAPVLQVREEALLQRGPDHFVMRVSDDVVPGAEAVAEEVRVEVGRRRPGFVEIRAGLSEGDLVVVAGIARVRAGARVRIAELRPADA